MELQGRMPRLTFRVRIVHAHAKRQAGHSHPEDRQCSNSTSLQLLADRLDRPLLIGKLPGLELRVERLTVDRQLETAAAGGDQLQVLDLLLVRVEKLGRQTDGLRLVVSHGAVFQLDVHDKPPSGNWARIVPYY